MTTFVTVFNDDTLVTERLNIYMKSHTAGTLATSRIGVRAGTLCNDVAWIGQQIGLHRGTRAAGSEGVCACHLCKDAA